MNIPNSVNSLQHQLENISIILHIWFLSLPLDLTGHQLDTGWTSPDVRYNSIYIKVFKWL